MVIPSPEAMTVSPVDVLEQKVAVEDNESAVKEVKPVIGSPEERLDAAIEAANVT